MTARVRVDGSARARIHKGADRRNDVRRPAPSPIRRPASSSTRRSALERWDRKHVWHPFTQQTEWATREPLIIDSGRGVWLRDRRGRRFIDGVSSLWVNVWGHRRPEIDRAIRAQLNKIAHTTFLGLTHAPAIRLARELVRRAPRGLTRVFYSDNGSTAVEVALKMAYQYWQLKGHPRKRKFVSLKEGYHGDTLGAVSVGGVALFHRRFKDLLFEGWTIAPPRLGQENGPDELERVLRRHQNSIAAVVMEPLIQGASGMLRMPPGYLARAARLCRRYGALLIVDEVATGFGRTGTFFAVEQENVSPDFLCVAKSLTAGYLPLAATLAREEIYQMFLGRYDEFKTFFHGHTYTANPLACAAALANLELYRKKNLLAQIRERSAQLAAGLAGLKCHRHVRDVRHLGLMAGIELQDAFGKSYPPSRRMGLKVCDAALERGVWLRPLGDVVVLMPPLAISEKELAFLIRAVHAALDAVK